MKLRFLILILCFCCGFVSVAEEVFTDYGTRISFNKYSQDYFAIRRFIIKLEKNVVKLLRQRIDDFTGTQLIIHLTEPGSRLKISYGMDRMDVFLSVRVQDWDMDYKVLRRLVCCFYTVRCKIPVKTETELQKAVPFWIQQGTLEYIRNRALPGYSGFKYYPLLRNAELAGIEPDPDDIINSKVIQKDGVLFYYYCELCEFMLNWVYHLSSYSDPLLRDMIVKTAAGGVSPAEVFYSVGLKRMVKSIGGRLRHEEGLSERDKVRKWFRRQLRKVVINGFMPIPAKQSLAGLEKLLCITYEYKEKNGGIMDKECPLDELGTLWGEVNNRRVVLRRVKEQLNRLEFESSQEFIRPLNIIVDTVNSLPKLKTEDEKRQDVEKQRKKMDKKSLQSKPSSNVKKDPERPKKNNEAPFDPMAFRYKIRAAVNCFKDIVEQRREIETYLDWGGTQFIPIKDRYKYILGTFNVIDINDREIRPELNKYLDQVEKDYIED